VRRRLTLVAGTLLGLLLVTLLVPLLAAYAEERTQDAFVTRLTDVTRFAVLAQDALEEGGDTGLESDLVRYAEVYGGTAVVTDANREVVASSRPDVDLADERVAEAVDLALAGSATSPPSTVWPWGSRSFVVASPVGRDAQVLGAVVLLAPTDRVREVVGIRLGWLTLAAVVTLLAIALAVVGRFVSWILRPVHDLDDAALRLAEGDLGSRVPATAGPPELRHLARSFNQMADHVETSQRQQRELIADASHQLGNPLTALRLRVENLSSAPDPAEAERALDEADRLTAIVDSLLDLSRVGAELAAPQPVDVAAQARRRTEMWEPAIGDLVLEAPETLTATSTPDLVDLVLDAVLDNAAKFAPGQPVVVRLVGQGEHAVLSVRDRGPGLRKEDVAKVGARFFRGRDHQNIAGTGLGLAIVRARVEEAGGSLVVESPADGGLAVTVRLRRAGPGYSRSSRK
jgi:signal transduction histidine kinase